jgi:predicted enzyme related to lactoylglutathione lyase
MDEPGDTMTSENKIDYVEFPARDIPKAQAFFSQLLGWKFENYGPDYCSFNDGRITGGFFSSELNSETEKGCCLVIFYSENLENSLGRVVELGGTIAKEIFSFPGGRRFHFKDPNDNEFAIWSDR